MVFSLISKNAFMVERRTYHAVVDPIRRLPCGIVVNTGREVANAFRFVVVVGDVEAWTCSLLQQIYLDWNSAFDLFLFKFCSSNCLTLPTCLAYLP